MTGLRLASPPSGVVDMSCLPSARAPAVDAIGVHPRLQRPLRAHASYGRRSGRESYAGFEKRRTLGRTLRAGRLRVDRPAEGRAVRTIRAIPRARLTLRSPFTTP